MNVSRPAPQPDATTVALALGGTWALFAETLQHGWARQDNGIYALVTGMPVPTLNGVWVVGEGVDRSVVDARLSEVAQSGFPFCLEARPSWREEGARAAAARQMAGSADIPLMISNSPVTASDIEHLSIRELASNEAHVHCDVAGPAFGAPADLLAQLINAEVLELPEVRGYVGEVDGEAVVTAMSVTLGDAVGIFNVATPERHRRQGYGAAITAHVVADRFASGAAYAWLQSSEAGYKVYQQLGFSVLETWPCWTSAL